MTIKLDGGVSKFYSIKRGTVQGSVLGPTFFMLFFNDIVLVLKKFKNIRYTLFADDLVVYIAGKKLELLIRVMQEALVALDTWCADNGLEINFDKTKFMIFSRNTRNDETNDALQVNMHDIEKVSEFKYLGVILDPALTFKLHLHNVEGKVTLALGYIMSYKRQLNRRIFALMINTYVFANVDYALIVWGHACLNGLGKLQNRVTNSVAIFFEPRLAKFKSRAFWAKLENSNANNRMQAKIESDKLKETLNYNWMLEKCNILTMTERLKFFTALNVFKSLKFCSNIESLKDFFKRSYLTANDDAPRLMVVCRNYESVKYSIKLASISIWNDLPSTVRNVKVSTEVFKKTLNKHLLKVRMSDFI
jgi:hypothetical protein